MPHCSACRSPYAYTKASRLWGCLRRTAAVQMLDDDTYVAADNYSNVYVVRRNAESAADEERARLQVGPAGVGCARDDLNILMICEVPGQSCRGWEALLLHCRAALRGCFVVGRAVSYPNHLQQETKDCTRVCKATDGVPACGKARWCWGLGCSWNGCRLRLPSWLRLPREGGTLH